MNRLKQIRNEVGMTQQQVADALGMHLTNYNKLENGSTKLSQQRMERLAAIMHKEPADFVSPPSSVRKVTVKQHIEAGAWPTIRHTASSRFSAPKHVVPQ
jgi:transcriptional regulator with XRE-family HTH domain